MKIGLALVAAGVLTGTLPGHDAPALVNTCLITDHVAVLVDFYQRVLALPAQRTGDVYAEFHAGTAVLAIFSAAAQDAYIPGSARPAHNASAILEFRVGDVDREFARLQPIVHVWIKKPATTPWHTRSFYFRDPDGNLVDFYAPAASSPARPANPLAARSIAPRCPDGPSTSRRSTRRTPALSSRSRARSRPRRRSRATSGSRTARPAMPALP